MNRISITFIFYLSICHGLWAQKPKQDSTAIKLLIEKAESVADTNTDAAFRIFKEAKNTSEHSNLPLWTARALYAESYYYHYLMNYQGVIKNCTEAAVIFANQNLTIDEAKCYNRIGLAWMNLNKHQEALQAFFKAVELAESENNIDVVSRINNNIGLVYESLEDWENALNYAQLSLEYKRKTNDKKGMAYCYGNIANLLYYQNKNEEALRNFELADKLFIEVGEEYSVATNAVNLGNVLIDLNQPDLAIQYFNKALEYQDPQKDQMLGEWCRTVVSEANAWLKKDNLKKTSFYLDKCILCEEQVTDLLFLKDLYSLKANYYKQIGSYAQSVKYLELSRDSQDSIYKKSQNLENQKIAIRYEFNKKAREDSLQYQLNISKQEIATASYKNRMYLLLVALLLVAAIAIIIINRAKRIQERKRKLALETMRNNIARDLHDDIGSTLSSIQIIGSLAMNQCKDNIQLKDSVSRISELSDKVSDGIREIVWSVNPAYDRLSSFTEQLRKMAADVLGANNISFHFKEKIKDPEKELSPQQRKNLLMICKETLNNSRKYSGTERMDISIKQNNQMLTIKIKDYGCGFDKEKIKMGNGLSNIERRAAEISAQLELNSQLGKGTFLSLKIPLP